MYSNSALGAVPQKWAVPDGTIPVFDRRTQYVPIDDIIMIEGDGNYTIFFCTNGRRIMVSKTLRDYEKLLGENSLFFRIHKSYLINMKFVQRYDVRGEDCVWLKTGHILSIARRRKHEFDQFMRQNARRN